MLLLNLILILTMATKDENAAPIAAEPAKDYTFEESVALMKRNARITKAKVINVTVNYNEDGNTEDENGNPIPAEPTYVSLTINEKVLKLRRNVETGEYEKQWSSNIQVSMYALMGVLKSSTEYGMLAKTLLKKPEKAAMALYGATVEVASRDYAAGEVMENFFHKDAKAREPYDHPVTRQSITSVELGGVGLRFANKAIDAAADSLFD